MSAPAATSPDLSSLAARLAGELNFDETMRKLGLDSLAALVRYAVRNHIIEV